MLIIKLYKLESVEIMIFVKKRFYYVAKKMYLCKLKETRYLMKFMC